MILISKRYPVGVLVFKIVMAGFVTLLCLGMLLASVVLIDQASYFASSITLGVAGVCAAMLTMMYKEVSNTCLWHIEVDENGFHLFLPASRSQIHNLEEFQGLIRAEAVDAIVTRLEVYKSMGYTTLNRVYALKLIDGSFLHLGEDRAVNTYLHAPFHEELITDISKQLIMPVNDLGSVIGKGGLLLLIGARAPNWDADALDQYQEARLFRDSRLAGLLMVVAVWVVILAQLFSR